MIVGELSHTSELNTACLRTCDALGVELVPERVSGSDRALANESPAVGPVGLMLQNPVPMLSPLSECVILGVDQRRRLTMLVGVSMLESVSSSLTLILKVSP